MIDRIAARIDAAQRRRPWLAFPVAVLKKFSDDRGSRLAALVAYYGFFSLFPLLLILVTSLGYVLSGNPDLQQNVVDAIVDQFPLLQDEIRQNVGSFRGSGLGLVVGIAGLLWAGMGVMATLQDAMNTVWDVPIWARPNFFEKRGRALFMLVVLGVGFLSAAALTGFTTFGGLNAGAARAGFLISLAFNLVLFLATFRVLTDRHLSWRTLFPGAAVGAVGWLILQSLGGLYVGRALQGASVTYGFFAVVIGILSWMYLLAQWVLLAAEVNVVRREHLWPRTFLGTDLREAADREALRRYALVQQRRQEQTVETSFESERGQDVAGPKPGDGDDRTGATRETMMHTTTRRERLAESMWAIPALCMVVATAAAFGFIHLDESIGRSTGGVGFSGGPDSARSILSTIASSVLFLTGLVFSITVLALQLTSSQLSPRALRTFFRDRQTQTTLGVFVGTFLYALLALREVRGEDGGPGDEFLPGVTVTVAFVLALASLVMFVQQINHLAQSIRAVNIIGRIAAETRAVIDGLLPEDEPDPAATATGAPRPPGEHVVHAPKAGVVASVAVARLAAHARRHDVVVEVLPPIGDFVPRGAPLLRVHGDYDGGDEEKLTGAIALAAERAMGQDPAYGIRQLVDIAERALSPGTNDPSTAVQCLDQIHDLLRRIGTRPLPGGVKTDDDGRVRVVLCSPTWDGFVHLGLDDIRHRGSGSLQVHRRITRLLDDLLTVVSVDRRPPLLEQQRLLRAQQAEALPATEWLQVGGRRGDGWLPGIREGT